MSFYKDVFNFVRDLPSAPPLMKLGVAAAAGSTTIIAGSALTIAGPVAGAFMAAAMGTIYLGGFTLANGQLRSELSGAKAPSLQNPSQNNGPQ